jgi:osmoprotectant transport system substrate-binding protein
MLVVLAVLATACGDDDSSTSAGGTTQPGGAASSPSTATKTVKVGQKNIVGAQLLSQLYGQALAAKDFEVSYSNLGPTEQTYLALKGGDIDLYGEYQGTLLQYLQGEPTSDAEATNTALAAKLTAEGAYASKAADAADLNGFYVTKATADQYGLESVSDLVAVAPQLVFGGPPECETRDFCLGTKEQGLYGLEFKEVKKLDGGGPVTSSALTDGNIQVGLLFTGSSKIEDNYVLLEDDKGLQPADNAVAVWSEKVDSPELTEVIDAVNAKLDTAAYNELSLKISNDKADPADVAETWLEDNGLT